MKSICVVFGVILAVQLALGQKARTYQAGVVEFATKNLNASHNIEHETMENVKRTVMLIASTEGQRNDVLVFPEAVLNYPQNAVAVPRPEDNVIACANQSYSEIVRMLSCAALQSQTYVVVQLYMSSSCAEDRAIYGDMRPCTFKDNSTNLYSAAVVFDVDGMVVAVYRKFNLFMEPNIRRPLKPDLTTFTTKQGVTFGVFICFDILFDSPANELVRRGVRNFVMPTRWHSELPYLTALQTQQMWAHAQNVTLLAAGANLPEEATTGTSITFGNMGQPVWVMANEPLTRIYSAVLSVEQDSYHQMSAFITPTIDNLHQPFAEPKAADIPTVLPGLNLWKQPLKPFNTRFLKINETGHQHFMDNICIDNDERLCCHYHIALSVEKQPKDTQSYSYAVAVFNGFRQTDMGDKKTLHTKVMICSVVACTRFDEHESCGERLTNNPFERVKFEQLELKASISAKKAESNTTLIMPNTLQRQMLPLHPNQFRLQLESFSDDTVQNHTAKLTMLRPQNDIQTFAIFTRVPGRDKITNDAKTMAVNGLLLAALLMITTLLQQ